MRSKYYLTKISCYIGYFVQAIINNFLPLLFVMFSDKYHLTYEQIGRLIVVNFCVQILVDVLSIRLIKVLGYRVCALAAHILAGTGLVLLSVLPRVMDNVYAALILSITTYAFGSGLIEVIISPIIEYLPGDAKAQSMSFLHSFYCWGQLATVLVTTLMFPIFGYEHWYIMPLIWSVVPFVNFFGFIKAPIVIPEHEQKDGNFDTGIIKNSEFYLFLLLMLCAGASELAVSQWSSLFAERGLNLTKTVGDILGPCIFAALMGTGRLFFGIIGRRFSIERTMLICSAMCFVCYMIIFISNIPVISLIACAVCGLSVSVMWPGVLSMSAKRFNKGGSLMYGLLAAAGDMGCAAGPWLTGFVADKCSLNIGFAATSVFPLILLVSLYLKKVLK